MKRKSLGSGNIILNIIFETIWTLVIAQNYQWILSTKYSMDTMDKIYIELYWYFILYITLFKVITTLKFKQYYWDSEDAVLPEFRKQVKDGAKIPFQIYCDSQYIFLLCFGSLNFFVL